MLDYPSQRFTAVSTQCPAHSVRQNLSKIPFSYLWNNGFVGSLYSIEHLSMNAFVGVVGVFTLCYPQVFPRKHWIECFELTEDLYSGFLVAAIVFALSPIPI